MVCKIFTLSLFGVFGVYDLKYRRVNNKWVAVALVLGMVAGSVTKGVEFAVKGAVCGFAVTLGMYFFGAIAGGDVKFFAVVGAAVGAEQVVKIIVFSVMVAGFFGVIYVAVNRLKGKKFGECLKGSLPFIPQSFAGMILASLV